MFDILATPLDSDIAYKWIAVLFPVAKDGAATSPYGSAMAVFSGMLSFFGGLFLAWHVLQGIVLSATSGKVLGEKFHQIWAPLRVVLGFGMLIPISGGFSSVHLLLRDVVGVAAVQMGNAPIKAYIAAVTTPDQGKNVSIASMKGRFVFDYLLEKEICNAVQTGLTQSIWAQFWNTSIITAPDSGKAVGSTRYVYSYGSCGYVAFNTPSVPKDGILKGSEAQYVSFAQDRAKATDAMLGAIRKAINKEGLGNYFTNHDVREMKSDAILKEMREQNLVPANLAAIKDEQAAAWNKTVSESSARVYKFVMDNNGKLLTERINQYGFMAAGGFERALSKASSISVSLANGSPEVVDANMDDTYMKPFLAARDAVLSAPNLSDEAAGNGSMAATSKAQPLNSFLSFLAPGIAQMKAGQPSASGDPVGDMITFGHNMLGLWEGSLLFMMLAKGAAIYAEHLAYAGIFSVLNVATGGVSGAATYPELVVIARMIEFVQSWVSPALIIMLVVGVLHAYVLPMMPMIMVFVMGLSWLIMFLEASIAAVLWAFVFIRMDGQDFFDRNQSPGATLLFNLFLRPAIGMLAFIGGLILLPVVMNSLTILWDDSFNAQTTPDFTYLVQWLAGIVMYTWMQWHLTIRIFGLIPAIPDKVGHWMGFGNSGSTGEGQESAAAITAAIAAGQVGRNHMQRRPTQKQQKKDTSQDSRIKALEDKANGQ
jgi:conjugal transfer/type IV secretion protein DotA/TraY